jgi:hypothetical protein
MNYRTEIYSAEHGGIATCDWTLKHCGNGVTETYREANAELIAAAPDMLEALRKAVVLLAGACVHSPELEPQETYEAVSSAIAKATGCAA